MPLLTRNAQLQHGHEERCALLWGQDMAGLIASEEYEAELERMNATMTTENLTLQHDNKQLNTLIKEYETTLETIMGLFRQRAVSGLFIYRVVTLSPFLPCGGVVRAPPFFVDLFGTTDAHANAHAFPQHDVQCQELTRIREYESRILEREAEAQLAQLSAQTTFSATLTRVSTLLRGAFRTLNGEGGDGDPDAADWALERECELSRLERENAVLRMLLGIPGGEEETHLRLALPPPEDGRGSSLSAVRESSRVRGGPRGTVGPFGTYKKTHVS